MNRNLSVSGSRKFHEAFSSSSKKLTSGRFTSEEVESVDRKKYPIRSEDYELFEEIGQGVSASVYRARCVPLNEVVAIKILDFERNNSDLSNISRETQTMILVDHPNVVRAHCSFANDHNLWVVMPYMAGGSCLHILKAAYPDGFEEVVIATVLREVLKGLDYLHHHGHIHRDVKAGNILIDARGAIKLGDFGVSACLFDSGDRQRSRNTFVGTPCWMAPEVMEQLHGYDFKADIWSFGITALELAHGHAPFSKYPPMKVLLMTLQNAPPGLDYERDRKFSKSFKQMIAMCLVKDPSKRPSAQKLLKHSFFKQARSNDYIARTLLEGLPSLGDRLRALKIKEADMLAQKKMPYGQKEELSQSEYKRGISSWNFNIEDMKAQASLIQDVDETIPDKEQGGSSSSSLCGLDTPQKHSRCSSNVSLKDDMAEKEDEDVMLNKQAPLSPGPIPNNLKENCQRTEDEFTAALSNRKLVTLQNGLLSHDNGTENGFSEKQEQVDEKHLDVTPRSSLEKGFPAESYVTADPCLSPFKGERHQGQILNTGVCNGVDSLPEIVLKAPKLTASNSDPDDKSKGPVVQQRGRFKVTSENVELEKALPTPGLHKSQSMQVIPQLLAISLSPSDATASNLSGCSLFPQLHAILQANMVQRQDNILNLMKQICIGQVSNGDLSACQTADGEYGTTPTATMERTLLDVAHQREKDLHQEINDLQWKLNSAQDELQKLRAKPNQAFDKI